MARKPESSVHPPRDAGSNGGGTLAPPAPLESWGAEELAATLDSAGAGIWALDLEGRCVFINQAACRALGYAPEECLGQKLQCRIHKGHSCGWICPEHDCHVQRALASGSAVQVDDDVFHRRDGTSFAVQYSIQPIVVEGRPRGSVISMTDITARKRAQEAQRRSDEWLGFAQNAAGVGIFDLDLKADQARVSDGQFRLFGLDPAGQWPSREEWDKLVHPEDRERMNRQHELALSGLQPPGAEYRVVWPDGSIHWLFSRRTVVFDEAGIATRVVGVNVDITDRVRAETALDQFFSASPTPLAIWGMDGRAQRINSAWEPILGFTAEEREGLPLFDLVHPEDRAAAAAEFEKLLVSGKLMAREWRVRRKDGSYRWLLLNASVRKDAQAIYVTAHDITAQKRTEEALRESEDKFRELFDGAPVAYHELDMEGVVRRVNRAECALLGYPAGEMLGRPIWEFIAGADREASQEAVRRKLSGKQALAPAQRRYLRRDGGELWLEFHDILVRDATGQVAGIRTALLDITERRKAEERIANTLMRQRGVNRLQHSLLSPAPLEYKLRQVTDAIVRLFDADFCRIWLIRPGDLCERGCPHAEVREGPHVCRRRDRCLHLLASSGRYTHVDGPGHRRVPFGCYKIGRVASGEDSKFVCNDVRNDPSIHNPAWARELGLESFAGYQLRTPGGETLGVLALFAKHPILADEDAMLDGLGSTVARVVKQASVEDALRQSEERHRTILQTAMDGFWVVDAAERLLEVNETYCRMSGYSARELLAMRISDLAIHETAGDTATTRIGRIMAQGESRFESRHRRKDGSVFDVEVSAQYKPADGGRCVGFLRDITERKRGEEELRAKEYILSESQRIAHVGSWSWELPMGTTVCAWTPETYRVFGVSPDTYIPSLEAFPSLIHPDDRASMQAWIGACLAGEEPPDLEFRASPPDGSARYILGRGHLERGAENQPIRMTGIAQDITARKLAEEGLRKSEALHRLLFDSSRDAMTTIVPPSWKFTSGNAAALAMFGAKDVAEFSGLGPWDVSPERQPDGSLSADKAREAIEAAMREGFRSFEWMHRRLDGAEFLATVVLTRIEMAGQAFLEATVRDITESKRLAEALERHAEKLARSNAELERFAYVASHDLQEPLRMVASFTQLLSKKYSGKLDETADRYINFAVDGAKRMQQLIVDLLAFSRVNSKELDLRQTDCEAVVQTALQNLSAAIEESGAVIERDPLPVLTADAGQLGQLFQNLIGNAIKFRGPAPLRIHISAADRGPDWLFSIQDNGIGIDPRYSDRIFQIFQRLHTRAEYPGTGIGLAVCQKVVERHGGKIWVESEPGAGSTFRFTISKPGKSE